MPITKFNQLNIYRTINNPSLEMKTPIPSLFRSLRLLALAVAFVFAINARGQIERRYMGLELGQNAQKAVDALRAEGFDVTLKGKDKYVVERGESDSRIEWGGYDWSSLCVKTAGGEVSGIDFVMTAWPGTGNCAEAFAGVSERLLRKYDPYYLYGDVSSDSEKFVCFIDENTTVDVRYLSDADGTVLAVRFEAQGLLDDDEPADEE